MPLKEKNKGVALIAALSVFISCTSPSPDQNTLNNDSLAKVSYQRKRDSLKKANPLMPMPPESDYTGSYIDKYDNGIVKFRGFYRFGERHGQWMSFYPNGKAWSELHFDKGLRHGPNITYFENGRVRYSGVYKNDKRDSVWAYFDTTGKLAERVLFKEDRIVKKLGPGASAQ